MTNDFVCTTYYDLLYTEITDFIAIYMGRNGI
ncbi:DUF1896 domain-containing protein [Chryseobacterium sediminis]|uniref:DUF1896 domain-containing protein n=1 Tax=Chryseobacterium sediminis TaxID=1679494 RepID=A0A5B2TM85_9FLAO|nr:DUF1896 domain-containing protein [Chryseobacterium sediminis]